MNFFPYFVTAEHSTAPFCEFNPTIVLTGQYEFGSDSVAVVLVLLVLSRSNPIVKDPNFSFDPWLKQPPHLRTQHWFIKIPHTFITWI